MGRCFDRINLGATLRFYSSALVLLFCACASPTESGDATDIRLRRDGANLLVTTASTDPYYYFAVDEAVAARISWVPCRQPIGCASVRRTAPVRIPLAEFGPASRSVVFFYYRLIFQDGGYAPDSIRSTIIRFGGS